MLLMIDNYDSFTYTLVQYFQALGQEVLVKRNDELTLTDIHKLNPDKLVISPGPGNPDQAGISLQAVIQLYKKLPILGVCLGHQTIAQAFGANIVRANRVMHGKTSLIEHTGQGLFKGVNQPLQVTRYHSLVVEPSSLPEQLSVSAWTEQEKEIMAIEMKDYPTMGVQFHPESVLTEQGHDLLTNFLAN